MQYKSFSILTTCLVIVFLSTVPFFCYPSPVSASENITEIDSYLVSAMERNNIPGIALAITEGSQIIHSKGYGTAGNGLEVTADTPFFIGSISKSFTSLAIMQLAEQGKLYLDDPVQTHLPWFRVSDTQASKEITIRHLLQHTSGLSETGFGFNYSPGASLETRVRDLAHLRPNAPAGTRMQYFNAGYSTLGLIIETISGQSFGEYIHDHIFVPLKMHNSFTDPLAAKAADLSQGYTQIFMAAVPANQSFHHYDLPAGFIMSSANDMARYLMALSNGGELDNVRILKSENVDLVFTPNTAINSQYGFGWFISEQNKETKITHGGDIERFHADVMILPDRHLSFVLLINQNHLLKDLNEYGAIVEGLTALMTGNPAPKIGMTSIAFGWGLFVIWLLVIIMAIRNIMRLSQWRSRMQTWNFRNRLVDILKHVLWIGITIIAVTVVGPTLLYRSFNFNWFVAFLPEVAIIVGTLILDDFAQIGLKIWMIEKSKH